MRGIIMSQITAEQLAAWGDAEIMEVLENRYGDGLIYIRRGQRQTYYAAIRMGLISNEGFLTAQGRSFLSEHGTV